jgi:hypothetical protein
MSLYDQMRLSQDANFQARAAAAAVHTALAKLGGGINDVQTISVTGTPTGGTFSLGTLPSSLPNITMVGTLTISATTCTGLTTTVGLAVGMSIVGTNIPAGCTIAAIVSATAITLSANATASGAQSLTFSGASLAVIPFNATAGDVQAILRVAMGVANGSVVCSGGPLPGTPVVVSFQGPLGGNPQKVMTIGVNSLTGGASPTPSVAHTTVGASVPTTDKALAKLVLANPTGYGQQMAMGVADNATVQADFQVNSYLPLTGAITGATNANPISITAPNHGLVSTQSVTITGVLGNTAANGTFTITKIDANTFTIPVTGNGAYTSGGVWTLSEAQIGSDIQFQMNSIFSFYG